MTHTLVTRAPQGRLRTNKRTAETHAPTSLVGPTPTLRGGQSVSALPQESDVDLLGHDEGVIDLHT